MKLWKLFLFAIVVCSFAACEDDEDMPVVCTQSDWVGTYTGTQTCTGSDAQDVTVTITASGTTALNVSYRTADGATTTFTEPLTFDGCSISLSSSDQGVTLTIDAELTGNELSFDDVLVFGSTLDCMITATKN